MGKKVDFLDLFEVDKELLDTEDGRPIVFTRGDQAVARVFRRGDRVVLRAGSLDLERDDYTVALI